MHDQTAKSKTGDAPSREATRERRGSVVDALTSLQQRAGNDATTIAVVEALPVGGIAVQRVEDPPLPTPPPEPGQGVLYTALQHNNPPREPDAPAAVDKPARRDALAEVYGADHDEPARPVRNEDNVTRWKAVYRERKAWGLMEQLGIPRTDIEHDDGAKDVIDYVKNSIPYT